MKKNIIIFLIIVFGLGAFTPLAFADSLGQAEDFNVSSDYDQNGRSQIEATVLYISKSAYFYLENNWWSSLSSSQRIEAEEVIARLGDEFDNNIYPKVTKIFGDVWDPGIDGDSRITILITDLKDNVGGYFNSCNQYHSSRCKNSNQREMMHVNADYLLDFQMKSLIGHELQHIISWNHKERLAGQQEDTWLNELRSEYVPTLLGYNTPYSDSVLKIRVNNFLKTPSDPLGEWKGKSADYGVIAMLANYLADQFGQNIFSLTLKSNNVGIESINDALSQAGYTINFDQVFTNWSLANYFNSLSMGRGSKYGYTNSDLKNISVSPKEINLNSYGSVTFTETVKDWSPRWYLINNNLSSKDSPTALKLNFESSNQQDDFSIPYVINFKDGHQALGFMDPKQQNGNNYIFNFAKDVKSVLLIPNNHSKRENFTKNDQNSSFVLKASTVIVDQPVITSISPASGPVSGGEEVIIEGGNFEEGIEVHFGIEKVSQVEFIDETKLKVKVPPHSAGEVNVWVKNSNGQSSVFAKGYKYTSPPISDGAMIRAKGDYKVYLIKGGHKRHILDGKIFDFYGHLDWNKVIEVTEEELSSYKTSYLIRATGHEKVFELNQDQIKHWLNMTAQEFSNSGRRWESIFIINEQERDFYKTGADILHK